jgi:Zn-dependent protease with chaperone function
MDFYTRQAQARSQTRRLIVAFAVAILLVVLALDVLLFTLFGFASEDSSGASPLQFVQRNPSAAFFCTLLVLGVIFLSSLFKAVQLREGGGAVARALGGVRIARNSNDLKRKRLHNVVEEMAIASGVPMPEIYVLEQEYAINAFAAGHTPANAAIAVTQGALDNLSRDELQGVIGHEFSHLLNGDMRLNLQLMGWLFGLLVVALIGRKLLRYAPHGDKAAPFLIGGGLAVMILGYVGMFFARLLQAGVSRQRERLADASSVQFTRNPDGLKGALVKIAGLGQGSKIVGADAEQAAHMLFAPGLDRFFQTHPPIAERIKELDPHFDVKRLPSISSTALVTIPAFDVAELSEASMSHAAATGSSVAEAASSTERIAATQPNVVSVAAQPRAIAAQVGKVETLHIKQARELRLAMPPVLRELVESSGRARSLVLALLLSRDKAVRERQFSLLAQSTTEAELGVVRATVPVAESLSPMLRLPALMQIFPALRRLPIGERRSLAKLADNLIRADARVDVFEFCLAHLLSTLLRDELEARAPHGRLSLEDGVIDIQVLFATLATFGAPDARAARMAYEAGMQAVMPMHRPPYLAIEDWPQRLGDSLRRLEKLQPFAKKAVIEGLVKTIAHDDMLSIEEAELLRTVCAALHCPLPLLLPGLNAAAY